MDVPGATTTSGQTAQDDQQQPRGTTTPAAQTGTAGAENAEPAAPISKNALKRLRRAQEWEDGREDRKRRRREKRVASKARRREERAELLAQGADPAVLFAKKTPARLVPVSLILDCDFEEYMTDKERISLSSQVTRCYSENRNFKYKSHLWVSGWRGKLKERFETAMENQHAHWKGVGFEEGDFLAAAARAREGMRSAGGEMIDALQRSVGRPARWEKDEREPFPLSGPVPELNDEYADVVYLTSESPYTLERLEPNTSYVIGGLVDKNREKGLCYRRAVERGIRTARLPIGQYMKLRTRQILATNHVVEIMLRWLECEDWAEAFMRVIPKRKGVEMIADGDEEKTGNGDEDGDEGDQDGDGEKNGEDEAKGSNGQDPKES
ncbi:tRNA (guanine(9)-N(1))-methyltransferase [Metarhizium acridum]|uniref:tRNA (guanine(9)-N1)-methyltransferase n=1 Tax=Metarhizium acridum (strain CQMa 102) TaxID=655827 RepID=E9E470_METAQ|nr:tRNA (guanine-N(1)-)-methyltransferase [Metarhizium acridum CQMa 102]EFY89287.1 tRNA (guanine-N(1)-)-methyltransferase [Metarhizium acridum CQMa 102]KAG8409697.1 tRNA (guanine(9)-N(1))-methyltransferase [Metarhizium acridum]